MANAKRITHMMDWSMVDLKEAIGKKIVDIVYFEDPDGDELHILLEDGKQIEISQLVSGKVHVQTD